MSSALDDAVQKVAEAAHVDRHVAERELADSLQQLAADLRHSVVPEGDKAALAQTDTPARVDLSQAVRPWVRGRLAWAEMYATAVPLPEAATLLGVSDSALRRVVGTHPGEGGLLGIQDRSGRWRVFGYQLPRSDDPQGVPGSPSGRRVQRALPPAMHPVAVAAWWDAPNAGLSAGDHELSPRAWLSRGYSVDQLVAVAECEDAD